MKLKSLELFGFKSFVDKTVIEFEEGVTAIVGPNGAGKSNCVDAIRWVMGEQSAKHLRGSEMQDVIFNGTSHRAPINMSQVILSFDLADGRAPAGYADYAEIQVERRLYRSGESEYYINKVPCRLRDIIDLFLGTGVGTKAYSIIEQGRIGHILSSKPEERRMIIEEAAGISKFKNRKEAALRRIESTEANLARLNDIVSEIKRQLNSLDRQARKAERYKSIYEELKARELALSSIRYQHLRTDVESLEAEGTDLSRNETSLSATLAEFETKTEEERLHLTALEQELSQVQENFYIRQNEVKLHETTLEYQSNKLKDLGRQSETYATEIETFQEKLRKCEGELEKLNQLKLTLDLMVAQSVERIQDKENAFVEAASVCQEWQSKTEGTNKEILTCVAQVTESQSRLEYLERREIEVDARIAKGQSEVDATDRLRKELERKVSTTDKDLENLKQLNFKLTDEVVFVKKDLDEKRALLEVTTQKWEGLKQELATKQSMFSSLEEVHKNLEGYREGVRTVLKASEQGLEGICGPVSELIDAEPKFEAAVSAALGEKLQYVVVKSQTEGLGAMEYLKTQAKGRSTFVPMDIKASSLTEEKTAGAPGVIGSLLKNVRFADDYKQVAQYLFGDCVLVEDLKQALQIWNQGAQDSTLVTLQGDVIDRTGIISGGAGTEGESLLGYKRRIEELQNGTAMLKAEVVENEKEVWRVKSQVQSLEERLESLTRDSHGEEIKLVHFEKDRVHFREELARYHQDRDRLSMEIARCLDEKSEMGKERESVVALFENRVLKQQSLEKEMAEFQTQLARSTGEKERLSLELAQAKAQSTKAQDNVAQADREMEQGVGTKLELKEGIEKRLFDINMAQEQIQKLTASQDTERSQLESSLTEMDLLGQKQKELKTKYEILSKQIRDKELQLREVRRRHEEMVKACHSNDLKLADARNQLQVLVDQILERYKLDIGCYVDTAICHSSLCSESRLHRDPSPAAQDDISLDQEIAAVAELRDRLEKLGSVHVGAIEEYDELKTRYEFLSKQQEDLVQSLEGLRKAIQKINRVSRERFLKTFELVNEKFQTIFPRLFKGGRAKLLLIDEENLLESGVEIYAQPPGKKLQSITLLSGGEKALTAVALIFSIFLIKPSPFCLLDEVDAPLDDANIDRFNDMVREMTAHSQFIVITHNKRTMEQSDALYGITMEEAGVSKVVSVRLHGAAKEEQAQVA